MLSSLQKKILKISTIAGIDIRLHADGGSTFTSVVLANKNNVISVVAYYPEVASFNELLSSIPKNIPLAISVSGKGILYKKLDDPANEHAKIVKAVLPDAAPQDFYSQVYREGTQAHIVISRKALIENLTVNARQAGYEIIAITLGPWAVVATNQLVAFIDEQVPFTFKGHSFSFSDNKIDTYKFTSATSSSELIIKVGDEAVQEDKLVGYCNAFQQFLPVHTIINDPILEAQKEEYLQKLLFPKIGWGILIAFLVILLANFTFFNHYHSQHNQLSYFRTQNETRVNLLKELQGKWEEKEKFIASSDWLSLSRISYYADRIAAGVPSTIILTSFSANPLNEKAYKEKKQYEFKSGYIYVTGKCRQSVDLNGWIKKISDYNFIEKVDVISYYMDEGESISMFELEIKLK